MLSFSVAARLGAVVLALSAVLAVPVSAQQTAPPGSPFLRIETGRHAGVVNRLDLDAAGSLLATASDDKTVRLWDTASGGLVAALRVPISEGSEGALYAVALSPDGKRLLASGATGLAWDGTPSLYLFDVEKRKLINRMPGLPGIANHIAYSPDGTSFAVAYGRPDGNGGVAAWEAKSGKQLANDDSYGGLASMVAFDGEGRMASVAHDGMIRLYSPAFAPLAKTRLPSGRKPHSLAFSPDGKLVAVGYVDGLKVDVLRTQDLSFSHAATTDGLSGSNLAAVGWAAGNELAAAGTARNKAGAIVLRRWADGGRGQARDVAVARDAVLFVKGAGVNVYFAAADAAWGMVDGGNRVALRQEGDLADFRDVAEGRFALSADGLRVEFGGEKGGRRPMRFDVVEQRLEVEPPPDRTLQAPVTSQGKLTVTEWRNAAQPKINGSAVKLAAEELSRSAAVVPGRERVLLGTEHRLGLHDAAGRLLAATVLPAAAWGVAVAGNGKVAVVALGDGSLRWYAIEGDRAPEELAMLFVQPQARRWIMATREGFFGHSDGGGDDIAGYQINRGVRGNPEWVEFARLYQTYYAPSLLAKKIDGTGKAEIADRIARTGNIEELLLRRTPPTVEWVEMCPDPAAASSCVPVRPTIARGFKRTAQQVAEAPEFMASLPAGTQAVKLRFRVQSREGGIGDVDVLVNNRIVSNSRGFARAAKPGGTTAPASGDVQERIVPVAAGDNDIQVRAYGEGNRVETTTRRLRLSVPAGEVRAAAAAVPTAAAAPPKLYVLGFGVDRYRGGDALRFAVKDMRDVTTALQKYKSKEYAAAEAVTVVDEGVTAKAIAGQVDSLAKRLRREDTVVLYFAGHGVIDESDPAQPYYYITQDSSPDNYRKTAASQDFIKEQLAKITGAGIRKVIVFFDTCHSGKMKSEVFSKIDKATGGSIFVFAASSADETALDEVEGGNGPFGRAVVNGLTGKARQDAVDSYALALFVTGEVRRLVNQTRPGHRQSARHTPITDDMTPIPLTTPPL